MGAQGGPKIIASNLKFLIDHDDDKCNDNSSVLTDLSGYGNSATMYTGTAMEFTGSQWVQMDEGGIDSTGSYTLCGWAKRKHTGGPPGTIVGQNIDGVTVGFELAWYDDNKLQFWWRDSSYTGRTMGGGSSARPLTAGQWYHLAVTFDTVNGKITTWVNGAEDTSTTSNVSQNSTIDIDVQIGRGYNWNPAFFFQGQLADIKMFNVVLSAADLLELYNYPNTVLPGTIADANLKGWWPLTDGSGAMGAPTVNSLRVFDGSGNANHGYPTGSGTRGNGMFPPKQAATNATIPQLAAKRHSRKMIFDGSKYHVKIPHNSKLAVTGDITLSAWIKTSATSGRIITKEQTTAGYVGAGMLDMSGGAIRFRRGNASNSESDTTTSATYNNNAWHHVVATAAGSAWTIYVDGSSVKTATDSETVADDGGALYIGDRQNNDVAFQGSIDECGIWNAALDSAAVTALYNSGKPLDARKNSGNYDYQGYLVGYWRNNGSSVSGSWNDLSGNGSNGIVPMQNLITNGDFDSDMSSWSTLYGGGLGRFSVVSGRAYLNGRTTGGYDQVYQDFPTMIGQKYWVSLNFQGVQYYPLVACAAGNPSLSPPSGNSYYGGQWHIGGGIYDTSAHTWSQTFVAETATGQIKIGGNSPYGDQAYFDNIIVKMVDNKVAESAFDPGRDTQGFFLPKNEGFNFSMTEPQMDSEPHSDYAGQSGRQQYISTGSGRTSLTSSTSLTVEVWAKNRNSDIVRIDEHMMARYENVTGKKVWDFQITTDQKLKMVTVAIGGDTQTDLSDDAISNIHEWHMYTYTFNAGTVKLYNNGSLIDSTQSGTNISNMDNSALEELTIGGGSSIGTWQGSISNAKIYDKVLTAAEVLHNYNTMKLRF